MRGVFEFFKPSSVFLAAILFSCVFVLIVLYRSTTDDEVVAFRNEFKARKRHLADVCAKLGSQVETWISLEFHNWEAVRYLKVFNASYWEIPLAASSNLVRYFGKVSDPTMGDDEYLVDPHRYVHGFYNVPRFDDPKVKSPRRTFKASRPKIIFVRNPLDRLLAAWNNFLNPEKMYQVDLANIAERIISVYRNYSTIDETSREGPSLFEFFLYLSSFANKPNSMDEKWRPMYLISLPCGVDFDYIGKFEQLALESQFVASELTGLDLHEVLMFDLPPNFVWKPLDRLALLQSTPKHLVKQVLAMYELDYALFGYDMEADLNRVYSDIYTE